MISNQVIEYDNLLYSIKEEEKAAFVVGNKNKKDFYFIPRSIFYECKEYIVKRICKYAFKDTLELRSIEIASDSEITTIENKVFVFSHIESINIPSSVIEIKEKCFVDVINLIKISIGSNNKRYSFYDGRFIIGKSSIDQNNYDTLIFSVRNIEKAKIPSFIEIIGSFSFDSCMHLKNIEFSSESKLQRINKNAFSFSSIEKVSIPSNLILIDENAFYSCNKLKNIEIPHNSQLQTICEKAFFHTSIKSLFLPSKTIDLQKNWCFCTYLLTDITIDPNNQRYSLVDNKFI